RLRLRRGLLVRERDAEALGEELDRADEVEVLDITHEADRVPAAVAAVAVVELVDRVHGEAGCALLVKRAAAHVARALLAKSGVARDQLDDVDGLLDLLDGAVLDAGHGSLRVSERRGVREREAIGHAGEVVRDAVDEVALPRREPLRLVDEALED